MSKDFLDELAELALGSRLKRLSDRMLSEATAVHQRYSPNKMQPKWFLLVALLYRQGPISVVEAAERLGISQPAVSQVSRELANKAWLSIETDNEDGRKRCLSLTAQGRLEADALQSMWQAVDTAAKELCEEAGGQFYQAIQAFELALKRKSLFERAQTILEK